MKGCSLASLAAWAPRLVLIAPCEVYQHQTKNPGTLLMAVNPLTLVLVLTLSVNNLILFLIFFEAHLSALMVPRA